MPNKAPDLKLAIISDVHIGFIAHGCVNYYGRSQPGDQTLWLEYALRYFRQIGIDALVVPGDMSNAADYEKGGWSPRHAALEMKIFGETFKKVFEGTDTKLVTIYGNHDNICQHLERLNGGEGSPWEDAFGEEYTHINEREVKGYKFVGVNWGYEKDAKPYIDKAVKETPDKPVFYIQHGEIKGTTCDSHLPGTSSVGIDNVRDYENVIALFGHTHCPITDERTIWQGAKPEDPKCTVISCSTFNYADSTGDLVRGENLMTKHALILTVNGMDINVERLSFWTDEMLALAKGEKTEQDFTKCTRSAGKDWSFTLGGERVMDFDYRREKATAPEFPEPSIAGLARGDKYVVVFFPPATPLDAEDDILQSYLVEAYDAESGELVNQREISTEYHVDHSPDYYTPYYQILVPDLKPDTKYIFKIYARECFQKKSTRPIICKGKTLSAPKEHLC